MTTDLLWALRGIEGLILIVGAVTAALSWKAYRRTGESSLAFLGIGFLLVSAAAAVAGVVFELVTQDFITAWTLSASFNLVGFLAILYSIYRRPSSPVGGEPAPDPARLPP